MSDVELDVDFVRGFFPALAEGFAFFDNAGGTQTLQPVVDRISEFLLTCNAQIGASYPRSQRASVRVERAVEATAKFINASSPKEVVLGPSSTMMLRILAWTLSQQFSPGDEIIVCNADHEANIWPWRDLASKGIVFRNWQVNEDTFELKMSSLKSLLSERTRLVAVTHVSNILGTINPIREFAEVVHQAGALICVDGVAFAPHRAIDVTEMDVDFYVFSTYKVYGPHYSVLYGKQALLDDLPGINHEFIRSTPYKLQPGNVNYELAYGLNGIYDYFQTLADHHFPQEQLTGRAALKRAFELIAHHEERLCRHLLDYLNQRKGIRIIGDRDADKNNRVPTISFVVEGLDSYDIPRAIDSYDIGIRFGDFYAVRLIADLGLVSCDGVVRVSMVHYNTIAEVDRLIKALDEVLAELERTRRRS